MLLKALFSYSQSTKLCQATYIDIWMLCITRVTSSILVMSLALVIVSSLVIFLDVFSYLLTCGHDLRS